MGAAALVVSATLVAAAALLVPHPKAETKQTAAAINLSPAAPLPAPGDMHAAEEIPQNTQTSSAASSEVKSSIAAVPPTVSAPSPIAGGPAGNSSVRSLVHPAPTSSAGATRASIGSDPFAGGPWADSDFYPTPAEILAVRNLSDPAQRAMAVEEIAAAEDARYEVVLAKAEQLGIPVRVKGAGNNISILHDFRGDEPLYRTTMNANAAISTGANLIRQTAPYNLDGSGIKVGVWDGGSVHNTHQEFSTNRVVKRNSSAANDDHATHVAGTIGATGIQASAKGMAPLAAIDSYDWNSDYAEMTAAGAASATDSSARIPISNHSYGYNASASDMGRYENECRTTDSLAASLPFYLAFWAAGNEQGILNSLGGYQSITFNGLAKNIMTVGAGNDAVSSGIRDVSKGTLASFSSMGPSDDGRIKPDVVANGVSLYSPTSSGTNTYSTYSGTSMASPNAAGSAALLQQLYKTNFSGQLMRASMLKALIIHTANDIGRPGPDYQYGWGYMNAKTAADVILAHKSNPGAPKLIENSINASNKVRTNTFLWDGSSPISATLSWTDPAGAAQTATDSRTPNLVNDLDLKITAPDGTTSYLPYVMPYVGIWTASSMAANAVTGTNKVDNVERVDIPIPAQAGTYTVTVGTYGTNALTGANQV